jgi:hypothetical protein
MKFAMALIASRGAAGEHLLQAMLHNFRRIHAAKRSLRGRTATASKRYSKLIQ